MFNNLFSLLLPFFLIGLGCVLLLLVIVLFLSYRRTLVPAQAEEREQEPGLRQAALAIEEKVLRLAYPSRATDPVEADTRDMLTIMTSLSLVLDSLLERQRTQQRECQEVESKRVTRPTTLALQKPVAPQEPSATAEALMSLRDHLLLARPTEGEATVSTVVLDVFYRELGQILAQEQVISLEEVGSQYDQEKQLVIDTQATGDPGQDNIVCKTENPGYQFQDRLLRPQEVIIYKFQAPVQAYAS